MSLARSALVSSLLTLAPLVLACSSHGRDGSSTVEGASTGGEAKSDSLRWPTPGTTDNPLDTAAVLDKWKLVQEKFYGANPTGYSKMPGSSWDRKEATNTCIQACPANYSDIVCHYYCWHPSYEQVVPNVRGCVTQILRGQVPNVPQISDANGAKRPLFYPEIVDYCTYQPYDIVTNPQNVIPGTTQPNAYDQAIIDKNKKAGVTPGVLKWVHDNEDDVFKYVMYTWYDATIFSVKDQQKVINEFYGVQNPNDLAECDAKRPPTTQDNQLADPRTRCQDTKDYLGARLDKTANPPVAGERHKNYAAILQFMKSNAPSLQ